MASRFKYALSRVFEDTDAGEFKNFLGSINDYASFLRRQKIGRLSVSYNQLKPSEQGEHYIYFLSQNSFAFKIAVSAPPLSYAQNQEQLVFVSDDAGQLIESLSRVSMKDFSISALHAHFVEPLTGKKFLSISGDLDGNEGLSRS